MEKPRILIVDDEESFLFSISKWFNDYDVSTFLSPSDALSSIMSGEQYDVILVYYRMPGMTGKDFLVKIKDYITSYKAILITAFSTSELLEQGLNDNLFQWVFNKPVDLKSLQLIIDNAFSILKNERQIKFLASSFINTKSICIYSCKSMERTISLAGKYACSSANILIGGQSGTGKEIIAHYIHSMSSRSDKPFIKINCSTIPDHLFESELFGYCKGAFTGADSSKPGKFTLADGGTIFLDEIGEMPLQQQAKLLRIIEDMEVSALGSVKPVKVDVRIICATNRNLSEMVNNKEFRSDLLFRLNVLFLEIPSLKDRREDIPLLSTYFLSEIANREGQITKLLSDDAVEYLMTFDFPGNVRELKGIIYRTYFLTEHNIITRNDLSEVINSLCMKNGKIDNYFDKSLTLVQLEKEYIFYQLDKNKYSINNTAHILGIAPTNLTRKLKSYGFSVKETLCRN